MSTDVDYKSILEQAKAGDEARAIINERALRCLVLVLETRAACGEKHYYAKPIADGIDFEIDGDMVNCQWEHYFCGDTDYYKFDIPITIILSDDELNKYLAGLCDQIKEEKRIEDERIAAIEANARAKRSRLDREHLDSLAERFGYVLVKK